MCFRILYIWINTILSHPIEHCTFGIDDQSSLELILSPAISTLAAAEEKGHTLEVLVVRQSHI